MKIFVSGLPCSGATLVRHLVDECVGTYKADHDYVFIVIRHPHDVLASRYQLRVHRNDTGGMVGLMTEYDEMVKHFDTLHEVAKTPHTLLRYERFYTNYELIFSTIEFVTHEYITYEKRKALTHKYSHEADDGIHGDHLGLVTPGSWTRTLPEWAHPIVRDKCARLLEEYDYE